MKVFFILLAFMFIFSACDTVDKLSGKKEFGEVVCQGEFTLYISENPDKSSNPYLKNARGINVGQMMWITGSMYKYKDGKYKVLPNSYEAAGHEYIHIANVMCPDVIGDPDESYDSIF